MDIEKFLNLMEERNIDRNSVMDAATTTAEEIHDDPKKNIVQDMVNKAIEKAEDTADAIEIVKQMLRSGYKQSL